MRSRKAKKTYIFYDDDETCQKIKFSRDQYQKKLSNADEFNYDLLHKWSLDNVEEFWSLVWDDSNIIGIKGTNIINNYNDLIKSKFL